MYGESFWNKRYDEGAYLYGTEPNSFLAQNADMLSSPVLSLSEGEGRNAVFLASHGLSVLGVDCSKVGLDKAKKISQIKGRHHRNRSSRFDSFQTKRKPL